MGFFGFIACVSLFVESDTCSVRSGPFQLLHVIHIWSVVLRPL